MDGVWRTIGGRRVFIKNGQSLEDAMKESGKFKKEKLEKFDLRRDKEMQKYIYDYTNGEYMVSNMYTQGIADGLSEEEAIKHTKKYADPGNFKKYTDKEYDESIEKAKELQQYIDNQAINNKNLVRVERTQMDADFNGNLVDQQKKYKVGDEINWGIKSTSQNEDFFNKVALGNDAIRLENEMAALPSTYTEFKIIGGKKSLDISKYSQYKDQDEALVSGKFKVEKVEDYKPKLVYDETKKTFKEYINENNYTYEKRISKSGKEMITIYDENKNRVLDKQADYFVSGAEGYTYGSEYTVDDVLDGKIAYKIDKVLSNKKSSLGVARQIVTIRQILNNK